jgi:hypothetical protein
MTVALPVVAAVAIGGAALLGAAAAPEWTRAVASPEQVEAALAAGGYPDLDVRKGGDGGLVVRGMVGTEKDRAAVQRLLVARGMPASAWL